MRAWTILLAAVASVAGITGARAADNVPYDVQVPLVLKALTYDRNLKNRTSDTVRIAVLIPGKNGGRAAAADLAAALNNLPDRTVNGMPVVFREIVVTDGAGLEAALREARFVAAYVLPGFSPEELAQVRRICESRQILPVAAVAGEIERGMAFAVGAQGGRPQIVVDLSNSKACGSEFDLALLRVARVIQ
jgi:hypothetical protein